MLDIPSRKLTYPLPRQFWIDDFSEIPQVGYVNVQGWVFELWDSLQEKSSWICHHCHHHLRLCWGVVRCWVMWPLMIRKNLVCSKSISPYFTIQHPFQHRFSYQNRFGWKSFCFFLPLHLLLLNVNMEALNHLFVFLGFLVMHQNWGIPSSKLFLVFRFFTGAVVVRC